MELWPHIRGKRQITSEEEILEPDRKEPKYSVCLIVTTCTRSEHVKQQQQATAGTGQAGATEGVPDGAQWEAGREAHRVRRQQLAQHAFTS